MTTERPSSPAAPHTVRTARPTDAAGIAQVHVASWRETYAGIVPQSCLDALSVSERQAFWHQVLGRRVGRGSAVFVAADGSEAIVGFGSCGLSRDDDAPWDGEFHALYVLKNHQRAGIGQRLTTLMARRLVRSDCGSAAAWVIDGNEPAARFYERLGAVRHVTRELVIDDHRLTETGYVWKNLETSFPEAAREQARDE